MELLKKKLLTIYALALINFMNVFVYFKSGHFSSKFSAHLTNTLLTAHALKEVFPYFVTCPTFGQANTSSPKMSFISFLKVSCYSIAFLSKKLISS